MLPGSVMAKRIARAARVELKALASGTNPIHGRRVCWPRPGRVTLEDFDLTGVGSGIIAVQNAVTVVSPGTERAYFLDGASIGVDYPYYPGYASAGTVVLAGRGVAFRAGDRVASRTVHASMETMDALRAIRIPDNVSFEQAAFCQLAIISLQGIRQGYIEPGDRVAVLGQGIIGILAARLAICSGADVEGVRLSQPSSTHKDFDLVIEASGQPEAMHQAMAMARRGGRVVLLGSPRSAAQNVEFASELASRGLWTTGAHVSQVPRSLDASGARTWAEEAATIMNLMAGGRLKVDDLITDRVKPNGIPDFYAGLGKKDRRSLGILLDWSGEPAATAAPPRLSVRAGRAARHVLAAARNRGAARAAKQPNPLRVALVGCGEIGMANARAIDQAPGATLALVADVNGQAAADLAGRYGVRHLADPEQALHQADVDAVFLCVPHYLHAPLSIAAVRAGKHVMVEKPIATNSDDARRIIAEASSAKVLLSVCFCSRYESHIQKAGELIRAGALGEIISTKITYEEEKSAAYWAGGHTGRVQSNWRGRLKESGGGVLIMNICHYLDQMQHLTGLEPCQISAEFGTLGTAAEVEVEDLISMTYRYRNGAIGTVLASTCARGGGGRDMRIVGREGQIVLQSPCRFYSTREINGLPPRRWHPFGKLPEVDERTRYVDRFAQAVRNGWAPDICGEDGLAVQQLIDAAYEAGRQRGPVMLSPNERVA